MHYLLKGLRVFIHVIRRFCSKPVGVWFFQIFSYPLPYRVAIVRVLSLSLPKFRPHYYACIYEAANLAKRIGYKRISVIEFGVAGGNGLLAIECYSKKGTRRLNIDIEVYGFDMGEHKSGLPKASDHRNMSFYWQEGDFPMNERELMKKLKYSKLIIGDVKDTSATFIEKFSPAPVACVIFDLDYSSTMDAFQIFEADSSFYLPRICCYFDDVQTPVHKFAGELCAIGDFLINHTR